MLTKAEVQNNSTHHETAGCHQSGCWLALYPQLVKVSSICSHAVAAAGGADIPARDLHASEH